MSAQASGHVDFTTALPASFGQRRLWFLSNAYPNAHLAYQMLGGARIHGRLDVDRLERAIGAVVMRHEVLRTTFVHRRDDLYQVIHPQARFSPTRLDHGDPAAGNVAAVVEAEAARPFDLAGGPLIRATVIVSGPELHTLLLCLHHSICDGWSLAILLREIVSGYRALSAGRPVELPALPIQYADYAVWQRQRMSSGALDGQLAYWQKQLADLTPAPLPGSGPPHTAKPFAGGHLRRELGAALTDRLTELARAEGTTPHVALVAAVTALLRELTGATDVPVGTAVAGRQHVDLEPLVGFFVNTLVIRTDHAGDPTFRELLGRVRDTCLDAYANQDVPFEKLVEELRPRRPRSANPFFDVMVTLRNQPAAHLELPGIRFEKLPLRTGFAPFPVDLSFREDPGGSLTCDLGYQEDRFDRRFVESLWERFMALVAAVVAEPDRPMRTAIRLPDGRPEDAATPPAPHVAPRTALESTIAEQWRELLHTTDPIGIHDNFFDIGGHSLLAVRAMATLSAALDTELPINLILDNPTIARLSARLPAVRHERLSEIKRLPRVHGGR